MPSFAAGLDSKCRAFDPQIEGFKSRQNLASLTPGLKSFYLRIEGSALAV
jgi:hypothetical protein